MKITYLAQQSPELRQPPFDGPANHMRYVARELQALGHSVNVAAGIDQQVWLSAEGQPFRAFQGRGAAPAVLERLLRRLQTSVRFPYLNYFESRRFAAGLTRTFPQTQALLERASWTSYGGALAARCRSTMRMRLISAASVSSCVATWRACALRVRACPCRMLSR